mmetsp:Transcript_62263/g.157315  ORF Transcript_62263/g.157315 Transcript_62263/m.157315 type:complete len:298 (-) Transcript_62263:86-979(-)
MEFTPWSISPPPLQEARFFFAISLRKPFPFTFSKSSAALSPQESPADSPNRSLALWVLSIKRESLMVAFHLSSSMRLKGTPGVLSAAFAFFFFSVLSAFEISATSSCAETASLVLSFFLVIVSLSPSSASSSFSFVSTFGALTPSSCLSAFSFFFLSFFSTFCSSATSTASHASTLVCSAFSASGESFRPFFLGRSSMEAGVPSSSITAGAGASTSAFAFRLSFFLGSSVFPAPSATTTGRRSSSQSWQASVSSNSVSAFAFLPLLTSTDSSKEVSLSKAFKALCKPHSRRNRRTAG